MGILVSDGVLPSGIQFSNAYISLNDESLYVKAHPLTNTFQITTCYRLFSDPSKANGTNIRVPIQVTVANTEMTVSVYDHIYTAIKNQYSNSMDYHDNLIDPPPWSPNAPM
jgi:hypothetical protein